VRSGRLGNVLWPFGSKIACQRCRTRFGKGLLRTAPYVTIVEPFGYPPAAILAICQRCIAEAPAVERLVAYRAYWLEASGEDPRENEAVWRQIEVAVQAGAA
jgi:hypothetical protein